MRAPSQGMIENQLALITYSARVRLEGCADFNEAARFVDRITTWIAADAVAEHSVPKQSSRRALRRHAKALGLAVLPGRRT